MENTIGNTSETQAKTDSVDYSILAQKPGRVATFTFNGGINEGKANEKKFTFQIAVPENAGEPLYIPKFFKDGSSLAIREGGDLKEGLIRRDVENEPGQDANLAASTIMGDYFQKGLIDVSNGKLVPTAKLLEQIKQQGNLTSPKADLVPTDVPEAYKLAGNDQTARDRSHSSLQNIKDQYAFNVAVVTENQKGLKIQSPTLS